MGVAAVCAAAAIAPAAASAKTVTYGGEISPEGKVAMDVRVSKKGVAKKVIAIRAKDVAAHCDTSGADVHITINMNRDNTRNPDGSPFGLKVDRRGKFKLNYRDPVYHQRKSIFGEFSGRRDKRLAGDFRYGNHYPADEQNGYPEENCHTGHDTYTARRGGDDVVFEPRAVARR